MSEPVLIERRNGVQWITINREERRNALNEQVVRTIDRGIAEAVAGNEVRAIVITGAGDKAFCAGADLARGTQGFAFAVDFARPRHYVVDLFKRLQECTLPVIARVNSHVMAGGFGLLCACDLAIAADDIRIGTTESKIGVTPMMILPCMLRVLPPRWLQEMCITGEQFTAQDVLAWGGRQLRRAARLRYRPGGRPSQSATAAPRTVSLIALAYGRSGGKGDAANIGVLARTPEYLLPLREQLTAEAVQHYFVHFVEGAVTRYDWPGLNGFNFLLNEALGGGGMASLRYDPQGKMLAQILMDFPIVVSANMVPFGGRGLG